MSKIISAEDIVFVALVYNYIANGENSLLVGQVSSYVDVVKNTLEKQNDDIKVVFPKVRDMLKEYSINRYVEPRIMRYEFTNTDNIDTLYNMQSYELLHASLMGNALSTIGVDKNDLKIKNCYHHKRDALDIYASEGETALSRARAVLSLHKLENLSIENAILTNDNHFNYYSVNYEYDKPYEQLHPAVFEKVK